MTVTSSPTCTHADACVQVTVYKQSPKLACRLHLTDQSDNWQKEKSRPYIPALPSTAQCDSNSWLQASVLRPAKPSTTWRTERLLKPQTEGTRQSTRPQLDVKKLQKCCSCPVRKQQAAGI